MPHSTDNSRLCGTVDHAWAVFKNWFWGGAIVLGGILPLFLLWLGDPGSNASHNAIAAVSALAGVA